MVSSLVTDNAWGLLCLGAPLAVGKSPVWVIHMEDASSSLTPAGLLAGISVVHHLASLGGLLWMAHRPTLPMSMSSSGQHRVVTLKLWPPLPSGLSCTYFPASPPNLSKQMGTPNGQILNATSLSSKTLSTFPFLELIYHFLPGQGKKTVDLFRKFMNLDKGSCTPWVLCVRDQVSASVMGSVHSNQSTSSLIYGCLFLRWRSDKQRVAPGSRMEHVSLIFLWHLCSDAEILFYYLSFKWDDTFKRTP